MSLPPGFIDELRTRISISQVVGRKVLWDTRKSNQAKGDMWAPCPFHQEKSASFHVDDRKGFYYCFGCHAKGDALKFIQETENVGFMEAVEIMAREAGMQMPARDPREAQRASRSKQLADVMEEAVKFYRLQLSTQGGAAARDYLKKRQLSADALARFEIGFAPDSRQGVLRALTEKGIDRQLIVDAGLCAVPEGGGDPYDRFRGRIIYPIRDGRGRCVGLGGRAMDPNARAKYLNSPDTELFHKGLNLYNHAPAREACGKGAQLIVCEGYMDAIALVEAGFGGAVAPLGTAVTEDQLRLMWRIHPEPVIALDGDAAGIRAALRVIDLALPLLEAGNALRFAVLPEGQDPDDLIKAQGREAMAELLAGAKPMIDLMWSRAIEGQVFDSPERRARLDKELHALIGKLKDPSIRVHYAEIIKQRRAELFGTQRSAGDSFDAGFDSPHGGAAEGAYGAAPYDDGYDRGYDANYADHGAHFDNRSYDRGDLGWDGYDQGGFAPEAASPSGPRQAFNPAGAPIGDPYAEPYQTVGKGMFPKSSYPSGSAAKTGFPKGGKRDFGKGGFNKGGFNKGGRSWSAPLPPLDATKASALAMASNPDLEEDLREAMILAILVVHPTLIAKVEGRLERLKMRHVGHARIRQQLLGHPDETSEMIRDRLDREVGFDLETLLSRPHIRSAPPVLKVNDSDMAYRVLAEELAKLESRRAMRAEVADAAKDLGGLADEGVTWRLTQAAQARHRADRTDFDADGGGEDQEARDRAKLKAMIEGEIWRKR
ncbi:DNA primase [Albirhodobacter sp. R86504]|uniref:DNA primase n=1 Tax=Albirhodobacter sp. R86504 TaxID=3093848 RepID=UPI00366F4966